MPKRVIEPLEAHPSVLKKRLKEEKDFSAPESPKRVARDLLWEYCLEKDDEKTKWTIQSFPDRKNDGEIEETTGCGFEAAFDLVEELVRKVQKRLLKEEKEEEEDDDDEEEDEDDEDDDSEASD